MSPQESQPEPIDASKFPPSPDQQFASDIARIEQAQAVSEIQQRRFGKLFLAWDRLDSYNRTGAKLAIGGYVASLTTEAIQGKSGLAEIFLLSGIAGSAMLGMRYVKKEHTEMVKRIINDKGIEE